MHSEGIQGEKLYEAHCALDKLAFIYLHAYPRKRFSVPRFLHLPHIEKHENNDLVISDLCVSQ